MKVVGLLMVHDDDRWIIPCLMSLDKYVDEIYVNLNNPTSTCKEIIETWPSVKKIIYTTNKNNKWNQGLQRENSIRMLDNVKPDIVLFPDSDETLPKNFEVILNKFIKSDLNTLWFGLLYYWNHPNVIRRDGRWKSVHHVRAYRWKPNITYIPYIGYTNPTTYKDEKKFNSPKGMNHWGYMLKKDRERKYSRGSKSNYSTKGRILKYIKDN
jgi:hypothetical protein